MIKIRKDNYIIKEAVTKKGRKKKKKILIKQLENKMQWGIVDRPQLSILHTKKDEKKQCEE